MSESKKVRKVDFGNVVSAFNFSDYDFRISRECLEKVREVSEEEGKTVELFISEAIEHYIDYCEGWTLESIGRAFERHSKIPEKLEELRCTVLSLREEVKESVSANSSRQLSAPSPRSALDVTGLALEALSALGDGSKMTQDAIAEGVGVSRGAVGHWARGVNPPTGPNAAKLLDFLDEEGARPFPESLSVCIEARRLLRVLRTSRWVTPEKAADMLGVSVETLHDWICGRAQPQSTNKEKINEVFGDVSI